MFLIIFPDQRELTFDTKTCYIAFGKLALSVSRSEQLWKQSLINHDLHGGGGLMVSVLDSRASGPGSSPGRGHCVVFLGETLYSHSASLHPGV